MEAHFTEVGGQVPNADMNGNSPHWSHWAGSQCRYEWELTSLKSLGRFQMKIWMEAHLTEVTGQVPNADMYGSSPHWSRWAGSQCRYEWKLTSLKSLGRFPMQIWMEAHLTEVAGQVPNVDMYGSLPHWSRWAGSQCRYVWELTSLKSLGRFPMQIWMEAHLTEVTGQVPNADMYGSSPHWSPWAGSQCRYVWELTSLKSLGRFPMQIWMEAHLTEVGGQVPNADMNGSSPHWSRWAGSQCRYEWKLTSLKSLGRFPMQIWMEAHLTEVSGQVPNADMNGSSPHWSHWAGSQCRYVWELTSLKSLGRFPMQIWMEAHLTEVAGQVPNADMYGSLPHWSRWAGSQCRYVWRSISE